jgi:hypothetical protein
MVTPLLSSARRGFAESGGTAALGKGSFFGAGFKGLVTPLSLPTCRGLATPGMLLCSHYQLAAAALTAIIY